jgi:hypothetical protein
LLDRLQTLLADIYDLEMSYDVYDFLVTDREVAETLDEQGRPVDEKLLIVERDDHAEVSLYLDEGVVERLTDHDPSRRLDTRNFADFLTAFEGVSHFAYYAWNASVEKPVRLLEMELQAEVDKFVATHLLLRRQGERAPSRLHRWLFDLPRFDDRLSPAELIRYRHANHYAAKYCLKLGPRLADELCRRPRLLRELREFYRLSQPSKIRHIESR